MKASKNIFGTCRSNPDTIWDARRPSPALRRAAYDYDLPAAHYGDFGYRICTRPGREQSASSASASQFNLSRGRVNSKWGQIESRAARNEMRTLVNEEGLPIIDIVEPLSASEQTSASDPSQLFDDPDVLPLWTLSPAEKARRRAERERILDLFEEEERIQQERDEVAERERWLTDLERRKEAAKAEMEALKKAREMQKKMGKALLRNMSEAKEREEKERSLMEQEEEKARERKTG
ncbi:hypothetical protein A0H81_10742 [Grifola frondosa]|uniref:Uncharacterized protein n=1 Tax=Grifola frondosa TaxID=5627 RepID=A0A1C7LX27_GRIFR|nr:hypothetical protein A0H81_10742 [Grifola frondosa]